MKMFEEVYSSVRNSLPSWMLVYPRGEPGIGSDNAAAVAGELQEGPGSFCPAQARLIPWKTRNLRFLQFFV